MIRKWGSERTVGPVNSDTFDPVMVLLANGDYIVAWQDGDGITDTTISWQRFTARGVPVGSVTTIGATTGQDRSDPFLVASADGGFVLSYTDAWSGNENDHDIVAVRYDADGVPIASEQLLGFSGNSQDPSMALLSDGRYAVVSWDKDENGGDIELRFHNSALGAVGSTVIVNATTAGLQQSPDIVQLVNEKVVVSWHTFNGAVMVRMLDTSGNFLTGEIAVNTASIGSVNAYPDLLALESGGFAVSWQGIGTGFNDIFARVYDSNGNAFGDAFYVASPLGNYQGELKMADLGEGLFVAVWQTRLGEYAFTLNAQLFDYFGGRVGGQSTLAEWDASGAGEDGSSLDVTALSDGRFVVTWGGYSMKSQIFDGRDGVVNGGLENDLLYGHTLVSDIISGLFGDDRLYGLAGDDWLYGGSGNDYLDGGAGADMMEGGIGSDTYTVDNAGDVVTETDFYSIDTVRTSISYTLGANIENGTIVSTGAVNLIGNELANELKGNAAANIMSGKGGADKITGGGGADTFDYNAVSESSYANYDRIMDFQSIDKIDLSGIDANTTVAGNQAFVKAASLAVGQPGRFTLTYNSASDYTLLAADVDGDGVADMRIVLYGGNHTGHTNFVF